MNVHKKKPKDILEYYEEVIEHGDYQRIAKLTRKYDGNCFTADYVRKVLRGERDNVMIKDVARLYFKKKVAMQYSLRQR